MTRTFTANFNAQCARQTGAQPYLVLEIDWNGKNGAGQAYGPAYYLDRPQTGFSTNDGLRFPPSPAIIGNSLVTSFGQTSLELNESAVGFTNQTSVTLNDASGELYTILAAQAQQRVKVFLWRMFDDPSVVWGTDNALMLGGILRPFDWKQTDNGVVLSISDIGPLLTRDVSLQVTASNFPTPAFGGITADYIPETSIDKNVPLVWGQAQRVPAIPIGTPFRTRLAQALAPFVSGVTPTSQIIDDPLLFGITTKAWIPCRLGMDPMLVYFNGDSPPTANIEPFFGSQYSIVASSIVQNVVTIGTDTVPVFGGWVHGADPATGVMPLLKSEPYLQIWVRTSPDTVKAPNAVYNAVATVTQNPNNMGQQYYSFTTAAPVYGVPGLPALTGYTYWQGPADLYHYVRPGDRVDIYGFNQSASGGTATVGAGGYPSGTVLEILAKYTVPGTNNTAYSDKQTTYACNALPSKSIITIEGYGTTPDVRGGTIKDFVVLGSALYTDVNGTITVLSETFFAMTPNLNDSSWFNTIGRDITTLSIYGLPRDIYPNLDSDDIWITMQGCTSNDTPAGTLTTVPAAVIEQYLSDAKLMNVSPSSINSASFTNAIASLGALSVGFCQLEHQKGLAVLQDICRQCHSVLFFDQAEANMVVLANSYPGSSAMSFGTTSGIADNILQGSLEYSESAVDSIVNDLDFQWRMNWDDITGNKLIDVKWASLTSIAAFGKIPRDVQCYLYWSRTDVQSEMQFWLTRWDTIWGIVRFTGFLDALILQPGDWFLMSFTDGAGRVIFNATPMFVTKTTDNGPPSHTVSIEARYPKFTYT